MEAESLDLSFLATPGRHTNIVLGRVGFEMYYLTYIKDWLVSEQILILAPVSDETFAKQVKLKSTIKLEFHSHKRIYLVTGTFSELKPGGEIVVETDMSGCYNERRAFVRVDFDALVNITREDGHQSYSLYQPRPISLSAGGIGFTTANTSFRLDDRYRLEMVAEDHLGQEFICDTIVRVARIQRIENQIPCKAEQMLFGEDSTNHISIGFEFIEMDQNLANELAKFVVMKID